MKKIRIEYNIDCGDKTCTNETGKICGYELWHVTSGVARCVLFGKPLDENDGWVQRCPECLDMEVKKCAE